MGMNRALTKQCEALWNAGKIETGKPELITHILGIQFAPRAFGDHPFSEYEGEFLSKDNDITKIVPTNDLFTHIVEHKLLISFREIDFFINKFENYRDNDPEYFYVYYDYPTRTVHFCELDSEKITDMYSYNGYIFVTQNDDNTLFKLQKVA